MGFAAVGLHDRADPERSDVHHVERAEGRLAFRDLPLVVRVYVGAAQERDGVDGVVFPGNRPDRARRSAVEREVEPVVVDGSEPHNGDVEASGRRAAGENIAQGARRALERKRRVRVRVEEEAEPSVRGTDESVPYRAAPGLQPAREEVVERGVFSDRLLRLLGAASRDRRELRDVLPRRGRVVAAPHEGGDGLRSEEDGPQGASEQRLVGEAQRAIAHDGLHDPLSRGAVNVFDLVHAVIIPNPRRADIGFGIIPPL